MLPGCPDQAQHAELRQSANTPEKIDIYTKTVHSIYRKRLSLAHQVETNIGGMITLLVCTKTLVKVTNPVQ